MLCDAVFFLACGGSIGQVVKQRLQLGYYRGVADCFQSVRNVNDVVIAEVVAELLSFFLCWTAMHCNEQVMKHEGLRALYISFPTTLFMYLPYRYILVVFWRQFAAVLIVWMSC